MQSQYVQSSFKMVYCKFQKENNLDKLVESQVLAYFDQYDFRHTLKCW